MPGRVPLARLPRCAADAERARASQRASEPRGPRACESGRVRAASQSGSAREHPGRLRRSRLPGGRRALPDAVTPLRRAPSAGQQSPPPAAAAAAAAAPPPSGPERVGEKPGLRPLGGPGGPGGPGGRAGAARAGLGGREDEGAALPAEAPEPGRRRPGTKERPACGAPRNIN